MKRSVGFTIVELAIVMVVLAVLATITVVSFGNIQAQGRDSRRISDAIAIEEALDRYYDTSGEYPNVCPSGAETICNVSYLEAALSPYTKSLPLTDARGSAYQYIRGSAADSYGLLVSFETSPACKVGIRINPSWWGVSVPVCTDSSWS